ncbi:phosphoglyceromutase [Ralstonia solanacearum]|nr:phosphoglyceromutase [Ralstonia solanacearum]
MTYTAWQDFNDAEQQLGFDLIPKGTLVPVRMTLKPGGYDDPSQGWVGGYASESFETGSVYLAAEFVVTDGEHAKRKLWSNIGLHSPKGPTWGQMGRSFIRAALGSARNIHPQDTSPQAAAARRIQGFHELDGLEFVARVDIEKDAKGEDRNVIRLAIEPDHPEYARLKGVPPKTNPGGGASGAPAQPVPSRTAPAAQRTAVTGKPAWAQ